MIPKIVLDAVGLEGAKDKQVGTVVGMNWYEEEVWVISSLYPFVEPRLIGSPGTGGVVFTGHVSQTVF